MFDGFDCLTAVRVSVHFNRGTMKFGCHVCRLGVHLIGCCSRCLTLASSLFGSYDLYYCNFSEVISVGIN